MIPLDPIFLPEPAGLHNTGSICYFNSLLQVLASCTSLHSWISTSGSELEDRFKEYIVKKFDPMVSTNLLVLLKKRVPTFGNGQESASEAFVLMLNTINSNSLNNLFIHRFRYNIKCLSCFYTTKLTNDHSMLFEFFGNNEINVQNMLVQKILLSDYKCEKCNNIGAVKMSKLTMLPEIIVCLFNVYYEKKIHTFPLFLEFPGIEKKLRYIIVGQIEHSGNLNGGHYWSRALRKDGIYLFNDNTFSKSTIEPTANTYMVIYHLTN